MREDTTETVPEVPDTVDAEVLLTMLQTWMAILARAIRKNTAQEMCEATRMILGISSVLNAYYPGNWTASLANQTMELFRTAIARISDLPQGTEAACQYKHYRANVDARYRDLVELTPKWMKAIASEAGLESTVKD